MVFPLVPLAVAAALSGPRPVHSGDQEGTVGLRREAELGSVGPGLRADLVVLRQDPVADIRNTRSIELVVQGGVVLRPQELLGSSWSCRTPPSGRTVDGPGALD